MGKYTQKSADALKDGRHHDGNGLYINVAGTARSYVYKFGFGGRPREMGLGTAKALTLDAARREHKKWAAVRARGENPLDVKREQKAAKQKSTTAVLTFKVAVARWLGAASPSWTNDAYEDQVEHSLRDYAYATIGDLPLTEIRRAHVLDLLRPIWHKKPVVAERVRQRIQAVFAHAMHTDEDLVLRNPAEFEAVTGALGKQAKRTDHHASLPYSKAPAFIAELRARPSVSARAFEFVILTSVRTCEALKAKWSEVDFDTRTWTVPALRMKGRVKHEVPLSPRAIEILRELRAQNPTGVYIFTSERGGAFAEKRGGDQPMFRTALQGMLRVVNWGGITVHGFRSTFRTWAGKETSHARETIEWAMAHVVGNKVERAYNPDTHLEKRRPLMNDWADYCSGNAKSNVLRFAAR